MSWTNESQAWLYPGHQVILSSGSEKLRTILAQFPASPFCLYLSGLASRDLAFLLAFIYSGEVSSSLIGRIHPDAVL